MQQQQAKAAAKQQKRNISTSAPITDRKLPDRPTVAEIAQWLRRSRNTIYKLVRDGAIPCKKVGRIYIFDKRALLEWARPEEAA